MTHATIITPAGHTIIATLANGTCVRISQDGTHVGEGRWIDGSIVDCAARLGAADGSESEAAYESLDEALMDILDVSDEQLGALRVEAGAAGDEAQVALCDQALAGDAEARGRCAVVIADAH